MTQKIDASARPLEFTGSKACFSDDPFKFAGVCGVIVNSGAVNDQAMGQGALNTQPERAQEAIFEADIG
ncbi:hypothetical protein GCM10011348_14030 [Marinobacterium nitratireducens]|uniref:Uncharacterized protein n=1 Tax=Marinobacterium nitratireducens TaxID=518897 RepID=A0A917ZAC0_9GAMM|nr:hypothetical protein GCM10011348_14030 [Marinobacterium nitratireducens]